MAAGLPKAAIVDAYLRYRDAVVEYGREQGAFSPAEFDSKFSSFVTGSQYDYLFQTFQLSRSRGSTFRSMPAQPVTANVVLFAGDLAVIEACGGTAEDVVASSTTTIVRSRMAPERLLRRAVLRLEAGVWKVSLETSGSGRCQP